MVILLNIILDKYYSMLSNIQQIINYRSTCLIELSYMHAVLRLSRTGFQGNKLNMMVNMFNLV